MHASCPNIHVGGARAAFPETQGKDIIISEGWGHRAWSTEVALAIADPAVPGSIPGISDYFPRIFSLKIDVAEVYQQRVAYTVKKAQCV